MRPLGVACRARLANDVTVCAVLEPIAVAECSLGWKGISDLDLMSVLPK